MNEQQIRKLVQDEMKRQSKSNRFGFQNTSLHTHNGKDSPQIKEDFIIPSVSAMGNIEMASETTYRLNLRGFDTPRHIQAFGVITGTYNGSAVRLITVGSALLTPTFYFQPNNSNSVVTGGPQYPFPTTQPDGSTPTVPAQCSAYLSVSRGNLAEMYAGPSEDHIVDVVYPNPALESDIRARATVVGFSKDYVLVSVPYLDAGWTIFLNYVIT